MPMFLRQWNQVIRAIYLDALSPSYPIGLVTSGCLALLLMRLAQTTRSIWFDRYWINCFNWALTSQVTFGVNVHSGCLLKLNRSELRDFCVRSPLCLTNNSSLWACPSRLAMDRTLQEKACRMFTARIHIIILESTQNRRYFNTSHIFNAAFEMTDYRVMSKVLLQQDISLRNTLGWNFWECSGPTWQFTMAETSSSDSQWRRLARAQWKLQKCNYEHELPWVY